MIERTSESVENQSQAVLNQVKSAAEIAGMRQDQIISALQFVMELQAMAQSKDIQREVVSGTQAEAAV